MATHHGNNGTAKVGANAIAEIKRWSLNIVARTADDSAMGDTWESRKVGLKHATGVVECHFDETDTNGQESMQAGTEVTLNLLPEGGDSGDYRFSGSFITVGEALVVDMGDIVSRTFNIELNGTLTEDTVT